MSELLMYDNALLFYCLGCAVRYIQTCWSICL